MKLLLSSEETRDLHKFSSLLLCTMLAKQFDHMFTCRKQTGARDGAIVCENNSKGMLKHLDNLPQHALLPLTLYYVNDVKSWCQY